MRTAQEMLNYCQVNQLGNGTLKSWDLKHFTVIEHALQPNETVQFVFEGLNNYKSATTHEGNFAYAVTDKRIIGAQKKLIGETLKVISLDFVNDVTFSSGIAFGIVTVDSMKEKFNIAVSKAQAQNISGRLQAFLLERKQTQQNATSQPAPAAPTPDSSLDSLRNLKALLDEGILTQEEFDAKKKQILGL